MGEVESPFMMKESRRDKVWKACTRCRAKKIKCSGEVPCQKCTDAGFICTQQPRKIRLKECHGSQLELLENSHRVLLGTVRKLYGMIRRSEAWSLPEPDLNSHGEPSVHSIAELLGYTSTTDVVEQPTCTNYICPEETGAGAVQSNKGEPNGGTDTKSRVDIADRGYMNVRASLDGISVSTSTLDSASPHERSVEIKHENTPAFETDVGDYTYTITQQTLDMSHGPYFSHSQTIHEMPEEVPSLQMTILPLSGSRSGATIAEAHVASAMAESDYSIFTCPDMSMMEMEDICEFFIPAWNSIRDSCENDADIEEKYVDNIDALRIAMY